MTMRLRSHSLHLQYLTFFSIVSVALAGCSSDSANNASVTPSVAGTAGIAATAGRSSIGSAGTGTGPDTTSAAGASGNAAAGNTQSGGLSNAAGSSSAADLDRSRVLNALGIATDLGPRKNADGTDMTDSDNPFGQGVVNLQETDEIFVVSGDNTFQLFNPASGGEATAVALDSTALSQSNGLVKRPVAADINGDGKDEIITAVFARQASTISFYAIASGSDFVMTNKTPTPLTWKATKTYTDIQDWSSSTYNVSADLGRTRDWNNTIDIAAGDIDGDGKDEIVLTSEGTLYVIDDNFASITTKDFPVLTGSGATAQILRVECGDIDGDGKDELVVSNGTYDGNHTATISVLRLETNKTLTTLVDARPAATASLNLRSAEIAIGDVSGDKKPEVILAGLLDNAGTTGTLIMKFALTSGVLQDSFYNVTHTDDLNSQVQHLIDRESSWTGARDMDAAVPILAVADLDGDGKSEIVAGDDVLELNASTSTVTLDFAFDATSDELLRRDLADVYIPGTAVLSVPIWGNRSPDTAYFNQVKAGDLDGDGMAEIVVLDYMRSSLRQYKYNPSTKSIDKLKAISITGTASPYLCLADVDTDGKVVKYLGHALTFSDPLVLAVLSSPPYWDKTDSSGAPIQDTSGMETVFSTSVGVGVGVGASVGFAVGLTVGEKATVPVVSNGEETSKLTVEQSYSASFDVELEGTLQASYTVPAGVDKVIFASVPVDVYAYEDTTTHEKYYVREKRSPEIQFTDVNYYNANNGSYPDIDQSVLRHTIGNPYSYPTLANATSIAKAFPGLSYVIDQVKDKGGQLLVPGVPEGVGTFGFDYSAVASTIASFDVTTSVKVENEISFVGIAGSSMAASFGCHVSASLSTGIAVGGSVGGLSADYYQQPGYRYDWGIFADTRAFSGNQFLVLNYWVSPR
jgi:hypothetical protein